MALVKCTYVQVYNCVCLPLSLIPVAGRIENTHPELFGGLLSDGARRVCGVQAGPPGLHLARGSLTQPLQVRQRAGVHAHTYVRTYVHTVGYSGGDQATPINKYCMCRIARVALGLACYIVNSAIYIVIECMYSFPPFSPSPSFSLCSPPPAGRSVVLCLPLTCRLTRVACTTAQTWQGLSACWSMCLTGGYNSARKCHAWRG